MADVTVAAAARAVKRFQENDVWLSGKFTVDSEGRIWRGDKRAEHLAGEYLQIRVMVDGVRRHTCAHRLVWRALVGPIPEGMVINHKNGCKTGNRPSNLEVMSYSDNTRHAYRIGLMDEHGENNPAAKLTDNQVAKIRNMYAQGGFTMKALGDMFGVQFQHVSRIVRGQRRSKQPGPVASRDHRHSVCERDQTTGRYMGNKNAG